MGHINGDGERNSKLERGRATMGNCTISLSRTVLRLWLLIDKEHGCFLIPRFMVREACMGIRKALGMYPMTPEGHSRPNWMKRLWKKKIKT